MTFTCHGDHLAAVFEGCDEGVLQAAAAWDFHAGESYFLYIVLFYDPVSFSE